MRSFIAFDISDTHRKECDILIQKGKRIYANEIKWVDLTNLHITLLFLGDIEIEDKQKVIKLMNDFYNDLPKINLKKGILNWNSISNPKTIWIEYSFDNSEFDKLHKVLIKNLKRELPYLKLDNREFLCHLTLGRVKTKIDVEKWKIYNEGVKDGHVLHDLSLYQSKLYPGGPVYTKLL